MNLYERSVFNAEFSEFAITRNNKYLYSSISRMYYSVFQRIKYVLIKHNYDYKAYLNKSKSNDRLFSHGTIEKAFTHFCFSVLEKLDNTSMGTIGQVNRLYNFRIQSDYKDNFNCTVQKAKELLSCMKEINDLIDQVDNKKGNN